VLGRVLVADLSDAPGDALTLLRSLPPAAGEMSAVVDYLRALTFLELGDPAQAWPHAQRCADRAGGSLRSSAMSIAMTTAWLCGRIDDALEQLPRVAAMAELPERLHNVVYERSVCAALAGMVGRSELSASHLEVARSSRS